MGLLPINVAGEDVRLQPVALDGRRTVRVPNWIDQIEDLQGAIAFAQEGPGLCDPQRGVGILAAVLADAGDVTFDVTGLQIAAVEGRREVQDELLIPPHQLLVDRRHRRLGAGWIGGAGNHGPGLRQGIDAAFVVGRGTEWLAVIEIRPAIPLSVPGVLLDRIAQAARFFTKGPGLIRVAPLVAQFGKVLEHRQQEPAEPDAFTAAFRADAVHAVVPVAAAHERQSVSAESASVLDGAEAMLVDRAGLSRCSGNAIIFILLLA
jgi:hypothetical protein